MSAQRETFRTSDGCVISYSLRTADDKNAPRLALIHSLALAGEVWDRVASRLCAQAHILTYDCRGHGQSERRAGAYTTELFARDLAELLDHVGWDKAVVAGCSMGGCVAQSFAGLYPQRVAALGLIDTTAWYGPEAPRVWRERAGDACTKGFPAMIGFQVTRWFTDSFRAAQPDVVKGTSDIFLRNDIDCYVATCIMLGDADLRPYLSKFTMPVSVAVGEEDYATPVAASQAIKDAVLHASMRVLRGRHLTPIECPDEIAGELAALLRTG